MLNSRQPRIDDFGLVRLPFPAEIAIETHSFCNLRCVVCPYVKMERRKGQMRPELFRKIVEEVAKESPQTRLWLAIMGEPLMDKRILSFLQVAREVGPCRVHLNTNGTFMEGELAKDLLHSGVESIYVAIDALTKETFDRVRPGGDFERVHRNVKELLARRHRLGLKTPEIAVQFIAMQENEHEMEAFHDYWLGMGAVVKIRLRQGWGQNVTAPDLQKVTLKRFPCPWLIRTMNIHWTGHATQCDVDYEEKFSAGDVNQLSIKEVWLGSLAERREKQWVGDFSHPLCIGCQDWAAGRAEFVYPDSESRQKAPRWSLGEKKTDTKAESGG